MPVTGKGQTMSDTSGRISPTPFAYYDPDSSCWRTSQATLALDLTPSSVTLPRSGSMRNGELFERPMLVPRIDASGCSSLLSTPQARDGKGVPGKGSNQANLARDVSLLPTPAVNDMGAGKTPEQWNQLLDKWRAKHRNNGHGKSLEQEAISLLPTPTSRDGKGANQRNDTTCLHGATMGLPSTNGPTSSDDPHPNPPPPDEPGVPF